MNLIDYLNQFDWVVTAKLVLSIYMLAMFCFAVYVLWNLRRWYEKLEYLEEQATANSAEAMMAMHEMRARLTVIKHRLFTKAERPLQAEIFQQAGKLVMMALSKERSILQWGLVGAKGRPNGMGLFQEQVRKLVMAAGTMFDFKEFLTSRKDLVESQLGQYLDHDDPAVLWESMRYSVLSGGKRLRAVLCLAAAEAVVADSGKAAEIALPCACAIELVHAMSLIHDDLPALDNDDLRRGRPTNHKVFGEAIALLAGDALLAMATEILLETTDSSVSPQKLLSVALELSKAIGSNGMVGGQVEDMSLTGALVTADNNIDRSTLESMHRRKTGALIRFSAWSGACLAGASELQLRGISQFAEILGLAFQITDDLLDVTGDIKVLGKTPGKDEASNKATWVRLYGIEESRNQLAGLKSEAFDILKGAGLKDVHALECLLEYAIERVS